MFRLKEVRFILSRFNKPFSLRLPTDKRYGNPLIPPVIEMLLSATIAFLNTSRCQSVFAVPRRAFCAAVPLRLMSARKESPVSTSAYFAMVDKDVFESNTTFTWF